MIDSYLIDQFEAKLNQEVVLLMQELNFNNKPKKDMLNNVKLLNNIMTNINAYVEFNTKPEKEDPKKTSLIKSSHK